MKVNIWRRIGAYLIDLVIVVFILSAVYYFLPKKDHIQQLNHELTELNEQVLNKSISYSTYFKNFADITHQIDYEQSLYTGIDILLICLYFIIIPTLNKGRTLGLYILGLKIEDQSGHLKFIHLLIRNLIINGILYMLVCFTCAYFMSGVPYFVVISIFGIIQILLVFISLFMILYRHDHKGLQDILSNTFITREVLK